MSEATVTKFDEKLHEVAGRHGATVESSPLDGMFVCIVERDHLPALAQDLRDDPDLTFKLFLDVTAIDWYGREPRFELVYHLYSVDHGSRIRLKTHCGERDPHVPSVTYLFPGADFHERETYDFFGIHFDGHHDLRRILLPPEYEHHPLRKEFPLEGVEPEHVYRMKGGEMMPRPDGVEPIKGCGETTP